MGEPVEKRDLGMPTQRWKMCIATNAIIPLVVVPFKTYDNKTKLWATRAASEIGSLLGQAVVIYV